MHIFFLFCVPGFLLFSVIPSLLLFLLVFKRVPLPDSNGLLCARRMRPNSLKAGDMWQLCGADPARRFTWDMANNDNHVFGGGFQPRARYDRCVS